MSDGLKQRIVGALVLGALGLIILPVLFDFADPLKIDRTSKLPAAPEIEAVQVVKAERQQGCQKNHYYPPSSTSTSLCPLTTVMKKTTVLTPVTYPMLGWFR